MDKASEMYKLGKKLGELLMIAYNPEAYKMAAAWQDKLMHIRAYTGIDESDAELISEYVLRIVRDIHEKNAGLDELDHIMRMCGKYGNRYLNHILGGE